jgi:hypothetical protein
MSNRYNIEDIKKILSKIESLKERKHIEKVKKIIFDENPDLSTTKKSSGVLLFFHNLTQETYKKLEIFFNKLENNKINKITSTLSESYDKNLSDIEPISEPQIKLSNAEKKLIKKKQYHKEIEQKTNDIYISDDDAFFK